MPLLDPPPSCGRLWHKIILYMNVTCQCFRLFSVPIVSASHSTIRFYEVDRYKVPSLFLLPYIVTLVSNRLHRLVLFNDNDDDDNEEEQHILSSLAYAQTGFDASGISVKFITNARNITRQRSILFNRDNIKQCFLAEWKFGNGMFEWRIRKTTDTHFYRFYERIIQIIFIKLYLYISTYI